jgi:hypothetical protein
MHNPRDLCVSAGIYEWFRVIVLDLHARGLFDLTGGGGGVVEFHKSRHHPSSCQLAKQYSRFAIMLVRRHPATRRDKSLTDTEYAGGLCSMELNIASDRVRAQG